LKEIIPLTSIPSFKLPPKEWLEILFGISTKISTQSYFPLTKKAKLLHFSWRNKRKVSLAKAQKAGNFNFTIVRPSEKLSGEIDHWCACIFEFSKKSKRYLLLEKSKPIKTNLSRILNLGSIYGFSSQ
jgi:hypothetical protein